MPNLSSLVNPNSAVITNSASQPVPTTVSDATIALEEISFYLSKLVKMSESLAVVDTNQRQRVVVEQASSSSNLPVSVRNSSNFILGDIGGSTQTSYSPVPEFWKFTEAARQNYQLSIRSNLQFT